MDTQTRGAKRFSFDEAAVWILSLSIPVTTLFLIPTAGVPVLSTKTSLLALGVVLTFIAYVVARLVRGNIVVPPLLLLGFVWLVPIAYALSTLFSGVNLVDAFFGTELETDTLGFVLLLAFIATLAALALRQDSHYRRFFSLLFVGFGLLLFSQIAFIIAGQIFPGFSATGNLLGSFSDVGMLAGLSVVLTLLALRSFSFKNNVKAGLWFILIAGLLVLILANSFAVWTLVALASAGLFIEAMTKRHTTAIDADMEGVSLLHSTEFTGENTDISRQLVAPLVALVVSIFFLIGGSTIANVVANAMHINVIDVRPSWQSTFMVGSHTFASSPLFGSGPGTFGEEWLKFRDRTLNDTVFWNIDFSSGIGYIPTSFVTTGVLGVLGWIALLGFFLYTGFRTLLFKLPEEPSLRFVSLASFTGALYVLLLALFATPGPVVLATGFALLGVCISSLRFGKGKQEWGIVFAHAPRVGFTLVFVLTLLLLLAVATLYAVAVRYTSNLAYTEAVASVSTGDITLAGIQATHSLALAPSERGYRLLATIGIERMREIANNTALPPSSAQEQFQAVLSASVSAGLEAVRVGPNDYQNWAILGNVYRSVVPLKIDGAYESAKDAYTKARALNPTTPILPYILAQLEVEHASYDLAEANLLESINLKRDYVPAILLLSQLEIQLGKAKEALQAAEAAAYFAPNDPSVLLQVGLLRSGTGDIAGATTALSKAVEVNPQYANARYFLGAMYALSGKYDQAIAELRTVGALSEDNAAVVASDVTALEAGKNPFTLERLRSFGIPQPPVAEPTPRTAE